MRQLRLKLEQARAARRHLHPVAQDFSDVHVHAENARKAIARVVFVAEHALQVAVLAVSMHSLEKNRSAVSLASRILHEQGGDPGDVLWKNESEPDRIVLAKPTFFQPQHPFHLRRELGPSANRQIVSHTNAIAGGDLLQTLYGVAQSRGRQLERGDISHRLDQLELGICFRPVDRDPGGNPQAATVSGGLPDLAGPFPGAPDRGLDVRGRDRILGAQDIRRSPANDLL